MPVQKIAPSCETRTILIISPDDGMASALEGLFTLRKYVVMNERTAKHALQTASLIMPALIIFNLDPHVPDNIALCRTLRSITQCAILLLAPREEHAYAFEYYQAGVVDEHIPIPVNPLELWIRSLVWLARQEYTQTHGRSLPKYV